MDSRIIEQSKEARELILNDLRIVIHAFNKFISIGDANKNLELSVKNYETFQGIFQSLKKNVHYIDSSDVSNLKEWKTAVDLIVLVERAFQEYRGFINHYFYIEKKILRQALASLQKLLDELEKTSTIQDEDIFEKVISDNAKNKTMSLRELIEHDVNEHDMFLEDGYGSVDEQYKDYILFSFYADKDEIHLSPVNQAYGDYLKTLDEEELEDIQSHDLESFKDDLENGDEYEGEYAFTAVIVNDMEDGITITSKNNRHIYIPFDSIKTYESEETLGEFFYKDSELVGYSYVHIEPTSAPADMAGIIFLEEVVSEDEIRDHLELYKVSRSIVGVKFKEQVYRFNLGNVSDIDYSLPYLLTMAEFRKLKDF